MQKMIVYQSHGKQKFHDLTRYSVLTLLAWMLEHERNDFRIAVYTDRPDQLPVHDWVKPIRVTSGDLARWRGPLDFVHRVKLEILLRAQNEFGAPLIYVDSDTQWLRIPDEPFAALSASGAPTICYMHKAEKPISASSHAGFFHFLHKNRDALVRWGISADPPWTMWNAGTVGIPRLAHHFIRDVLQFTDEMHPHAAHGDRNLVEQVAISLVAASRFEIRPFDAHLEHWWPYGTALPIFLRRLFDSLPPETPATEQAARAAQFKIVETELCAIQNQLSHRFALWLAKMRNSYHKRKVDLLAYALRRRLRRAD
jgi:hypothetical protein